MHSVLQRKADQLKAAFAARDHNRILWKQKTKPLLLRILEQVVKETELDYRVYDIDNTENGEAVGLQFQVTPSGLVEMEGDMVDFQVANRLNQRKRPLFKRGGYLNFAQNYNGSIFVFIGFPSVDERIRESDIMALGECLPNDITEQLIISKVIAFVSEMVQWELHRSNAKIGFVFGKDRKSTPSTDLPGA